MALYCESCGTLIPDGKPFCPQCGSRAPSPEMILKPPPPAPRPRETHRPDAKQMPKATPPRATPPPALAPTPAATPKPRKNKGMLVIMVVCLVLALVLAVVLVFSLLRKGVEQAPKGSEPPATTPAAQVTVPTTAVTKPGTATEPVPETTAPIPDETVPTLHSDELETMAREYMTALINCDIITMDRLDYSNVEEDFLTWYLDGADLETALVQVGEDMNRTLTTAEDLLNCYSEWAVEDNEAYYGRDYTIYFKTLEAKLLNQQEKDAALEILHSGHSFWSEEDLWNYADLDAIEEMAVVSVRVSFDEEEWQHYDLYFVEVQGIWWVMDNCLEDLSQ